MRLAKQAILAVILSSGLFAQELPYKKVDRYYTGIGIEFFKMEATTKLYGFAGGTCDNESGQFSGKVIVARILEDGPAAQAGLKTCDVVSKIYGKDFSRKTIEEVSQVIQDGNSGSEILISIERLENNRFVNREFNVRRDRVDRAKWTSLGLALKSATSSGDYQVELKSWVNEVSGTGEFEYNYKVANKGKKSFAVQWEALDIALEAGFGVPNIVIIEPGKSASASVITEEFPVFVQKTIYVSGIAEELTRTEEYEEGKFYKLKLSNSTFWLEGMGGVAGAFVPLNWLIRSEWYQEERRKYWP